MPQARATDLVIGNSKAVSVFDLVQGVLNIFGLEKIVIKAIDKNLRDSISPTLIADIGKANAHLDWYPTRDVTDTIVEMVKSKLEQR
jgi:nucleoside-diphosphate-sugar epimerase